MEQPTQSEPRIVADETFSLPAWLPVPGLGVLPINTFVIRGPAPVLIDTGMSALRAPFMAALRETIDPADLRWIWLTHIDPDHVGNLEAVLAEAPQARVVTSYIGMAKLSLRELPVDRVWLLNPGQQLDIGDRRLHAVRPPIYDAPETTGAYDSATGALFSSDCCGALLPGPAETAGAVDGDTLRAGMLAWAAVDAPWLPLVDRERFASGLGVIRDLRPTGIYSSHLPAAPGMSEPLLRNLADAPDAPPFVGPDQKALEQMMAAAAAVA